MNATPVSVYRATMDPAKPLDGGAARQIISEHGGTVLAQEPGVIVYVSSPNRNFDIVKALALAVEQQPAAVTGGAHREKIAEHREAERP